MTKRVRWILLISTAIVLTVVGWRVYVKTFPSRPAEHDGVIEQIQVDSIGSVLLYVREKGTDKDGPMGVMIIMIRPSTVVRGKGPKDGQRVRAWCDNSTIMETRPPRRFVDYVHYE